MILLQTSDFTGRYTLNLNAANTPILQDVINDYEKQYILKLLGVDLGLLFIADLLEVSQDPRFTVIQEPFEIQYNGCNYQSKGMLTFLKAVIYSIFVTDRQVRNSDNGVSFSINEAQTIATPQQAAREGEKKWNEILDTVAAIQWYCTVYAPFLNPDTPEMQYPEYNGECFKPKFSPLL